MTQRVARTSDFVLRPCLYLFTASLLHAQPPTPQALVFDVASIKPNNSGAMGESVRFYPPSGRVTMTNVTLKGLVRQAYQLQDSQLTGGPSWIGSDHFDIVASSEQINLSPPQRWMMIKALILERFKLKVHTEFKEQSVFALVLARKDGRFGEGLRRTAADCAALKPPTAPPPYDPVHPPACFTIMGGPGRLTLRGVEMTWVAQQLSARVGRAVVDRSGLSGFFDVNLEFAPQSRPSDLVDPSSAAADRPADNGVSIFTALQEQLGLKLDSQKSSVEVLVIESAEKPVE